jgi:hypothetical protein
MLKKGSHGISPLLKETVQPNEIVVKYYRFTVVGYNNSCKLFRRNSVSYVSLFYFGGSAALTNFKLAAPAAFTSLNLAA